MKIKEINIANIEEIKTLFLEIFTTDPWNDDWSDAEQLHNYLVDLIGNVNSLTLGLYDNDELIGISMGYIMHWFSGTEYYIFEFGIKPNYQGKGAGTTFMNGVQENAEKRGVNHIFLQTERTAPAFKFYQKNGFIDLKDHVSMYKNF